MDGLSWTVDHRHPQASGIEDKPASTTAIIYHAVSPNPTSQSVCQAPSDPRVVPGFNVNGARLSGDPYNPYGLCFLGASGETSTAHRGPWILDSWDRDTE
ncbi:uncharacterized protein ACLA_024200 [Aspergillus clavatus NRRL 1]|uniref:Uncharacterized protein n=1 Tax=Aspergillus clavatus (strain ATCC 1007 / CBS 513.65 / DSM 816 / NCTC 3887 / NRRL 1 / QM 1276 / 107) TaxID=344612 RepID=A1CPY4_ASPCL|nr:uncharacterized protein ACLA_024200 [Aspergillus clavatus NRRL 1]EAW07705.1 hypothetical protein ACLA_024200 [Aspergillus clavatus NRRL 1]